MVLITARLRRNSRQRQRRENRRICLDPAAASNIGIHTKSEDGILDDYAWPHMSSKLLRLVWSHHLQYQLIPIAPRYKREAIWNRLSRNPVGSGASGGQCSSYETRRCAKEELVQGNGMLGWNGTAEMGLWVESEPRNATNAKTIVWLTVAYYVKCCSSIGCWIDVMLRQVLVDVQVHINEWGSGLAVQVNCIRQVRMMGI